MNNEFMYTPNSDIKNYTLFRLWLLVDLFIQPKQDLKVLKPTNELLCLLSNVDIYFICLCRLFEYIYYYLDLTL